MKKSILFLSLLGAIYSCSQARHSQADVVAYGPTKVQRSAAIGVEAMLKDFEKKNGERTEYTFEADIQQVCAKAGCWINVDKGNGDTFMVRFKDHFTIPTATPIGSRAVLHGVAYTDTISVDMLRHFAEDAGKSEAEIQKITEPKIKFGFEADGILVYSSNTKK